MARELLLMRHGKSDWDRGAPDFDRELNERGRLAAARVGRWIAENGLRPARVVSSPAQRARQTTERVCLEVGFPMSDVTWEAPIYEAATETLCELLKRQPDAATRVLLIGHNPGFDSLVRYVCRTVRPRRKLMPTAALAHIRMSQSWADVTRGCGELASLIHPKELPD